MPTILEDSDIYLPDFSYAGYHWGEKEIPQMQATLFATDFGVVANDSLDDTDALKAAFTAAHSQSEPVVLALPAGRVIISDILYIERSNFVLQGAGSGAEGTILYFPKPLNTLPTPTDMIELEEYLHVNNKRQREPERGIDSLYSLYAWSGAYFWTRVPGEAAKTYMSKYYKPDQVLASILEGARGSHELIVDQSDGLSVGDVVRVNWYNKSGENSSLIKHLYDNQDVMVGSRHWENPNMPVIKQEVTIVEINAEVIKLKEPLMHDLRPEWAPTLTEWKHLEEIGMEHLRFEFAYEPYFAHHLEAGYNGIYYANVANSWVKDVSFHNGDSGFLSDVCANVTVENVKVTGRKYHYAVHFGDVYDMLGKNIHVNCDVYHSLSFNTGARNCVFTHSVVTEVPSLDQHSGANHQNLFDDIKLIEADPNRTFFYMGGDGYWSPTHGAFSTFWNIQVDFTYDEPKELPLQIKGVTNGPSARLIGVTGNYPMEINYGPGAYMEGINAKNIAVPSLYEYQFEQRLNRMNK
ncbi:MAG: hypothetical protein U9Q77_13515 [Candidatus Marinimicrobia bacterium]|nr:hypothetical protein [Candidatus Neomarinimicrobiota bacterium]